MPHRVLEPGSAHATRGGSIPRGEDAYASSISCHAHCSDRNPKLHTILQQNQNAWNASFDQVLRLLGAAGGRVGARTVGTKNAVGGSHGVVLYS